MHSYDTHPWIHECAQSSAHLHTYTHSVVCSLAHIYTLSRTPTHIHTQSPAYSHIYIYTQSSASALYLDTLLKLGQWKLAIIEPGCPVLRRSVLYCTAQSCDLLLHRTALYCSVLHCTSRYCIDTDLFKIDTDLFKIDTDLFALTRSTTHYSLLTSHSFTHFL